MSGHSFNPGNFRSWNLSLVLNVREANLMTELFEMCSPKYCLLYRNRILVSDDSFTVPTQSTNSVTFSSQANYTDWSTATCRRNLVPTFVDTGMSRGQRGGSLTVVNLSFLDHPAQSTPDLISLKNFLLKNVSKQIVCPTYIGMVANVTSHTHKQWAAMHYTCRWTAFNLNYTVPLRSYCC
jgi:hypothetical protein